MSIDVNQEIKILKEKIEMLEHRIDNITCHESNFTLDKRATDDDLITRSYRIHKSAIDDFNKTISSNELKVFSVQDLVSQALWEFSEKYSDK